MTGAECWCIKTMISRRFKASRLTCYLLDFYVDVEDTASLHLAALLHPEIESRRIFAYAGPYTWKMMQDILRSAYPDRTFGPDMPDHALDRSIIAELPLSLQLLKDMGRGGWSSLEDIVLKNTADLYSSNAATAK